VLHYQTLIKGLKPAQAGFVCVATVSTAGSLFDVFLMSKRSKHRVGRNQGEQLSLFEKDILA